MKLATFRDGTRDGALAVVSRDLTRAVRAETAVAGLRTLQQLLDDWQSTQLKVERIYAELNEAVDGRRPAPFEIVEFEESRCTAPLPRAYQWADGSAYVNHVELVRRARGAEMPASFWTEPLMYQGGSDAFLGPCEPIELEDEAFHRRVADAYWALARTYPERFIAVDASAPPGDIEAEIRRHVEPRLGGGSPS